MSEKNRRIYYQDIVYKVCNLLDKHYGRKPGTGLVCGTIEEPSNEVQDELATLLTEHAALKRETPTAGETARLMGILDRYQKRGPSDLATYDTMLWRKLERLHALLADTQEANDD